MTLDQWADKYGMVADTHASGSRFVLISGAIDDQRDALWELHHLDDYLVSSVSGPTRWMVPRS